MAFPTTYDTFPTLTNATFNVISGEWEGGDANDAADLNAAYLALQAIEARVGLTGDTAGTNTHEGRLKQVETTAALITFATAAPTATLDSLWLDTDETPSTGLRRGNGTSFALIGADALSVAGYLINTADTPANGDALTWDSATSRLVWAPAGGFINPMTTEWDLIRGGTSGAATRLPIGTAGQTLIVQSDGTLAYQTAPWIPLPSGAPEGAGLFRIGGAWTYIAPSSTSGNVLTSNGTGAAPSYQPVPASPPGGALTAPTGPRVGALPMYDETNTWIALLPGPAGTVLTSHGDNNVAGSKLTWTTPAAGLTNPMTATGDIIVATGGGTPDRLPINADTNRVLRSTGTSLSWQTLGGIKLDTYLDWTYQGSAPATPAASTGRLYAKTDGKLYFKNAAGLEQDLTSTGGSGSAHIIEDEGTPLTARANLNFVGAGVAVTDDAGNNASVVTISGGGGGGGGSQLARTTSGLVLWHDYALVPDHALTTTADALGYQVATTIDHGTWAFRNGLLVCTAGANPEDCRNMAVSQLYGVFQTHFYTTNVGTLQAGPQWAVQAGVDTRVFYLVRNGDATLWDRTAGAWGSSHAGTAPTGMLQDQWICAKVRWSATQVLNAYTNRVLLDPAVNFTSHPTTAGGFGLISVSAANTKFRDYAIYTSTVLTVAGLTGTQAFRILDPGGRVVGTSATQSSGTATIDLALLTDCPFVGSIEVHASTAFAGLVTGGRYPAEGYAGNIWGGDTYTYVP